MKAILKALTDLLRALALVLAAAFAFPALLAQGGRFSDRLDVLTHFTPIWLGGLLLALLVWAVTGRHGRTTPVLVLIGVLSALTLMIPELTAKPSPGGKVDGETLKIVQFNLWGRNRDPEGTARWILATDPESSSSRRASPAPAASPGPWRNAIRTAPPAPSPGPARP